MTILSGKRPEIDQLQEPPGPRLPVTVQTLLFGKYRHRLLPALQRRYGDVFMLRIAPHRRRLIVVWRPEDLRTVFSGRPEVFHAGEGNAVLGPVMGSHSVLLLDESEHLRVRQLLMPAFHGAALRGYVELIAELAERETAGWPIGTPTPIHPRMQALTLEIILRAVFGVTDEERLTELRGVVGQVVEISPIKMLGWFYPPLRKVWPWSRFAGIASALDTLLYAEIAERRQASDLHTRSDVLSMLLRVPDTGEGGLTDEELRDNLITLLLAGHETTATALAWALHDLSRDGKVRARARQAADSGDGEYLEAVAKEAMRLHPVIYEVARRVTQPVQLAGYRIRAGATVVPAIGLVQLSPEHHHEPEFFDPTRFLGEQLPTNAWIPFGGGVRRCLGAGFALTEARVILGEVLRRFDIEPDRAETEPARARNITLAPARGARVILTPRRH